MNHHHDDFETRRRRRAEREAAREERRAERRRRHAHQRAQNPHRLYRDTDDRRIMGVCSGIAGYFGVEPWIVRGCFIAAAFFFPFPVIPAYFLAGLVLPKKPRDLFKSYEEEALWREVTVAPDRSFYALKLKFSDLEARLRRLESDVVSGDFELRRKFRDLGV